MIPLVEYHFSTLWGLSGDWKRGKTEYYKQGQLKKQFNISGKNANCLYLQDFEKKGGELGFI